MTSFKVWLLTGIFIVATPLMPSAWAAAVYTYTGNLFDNASGDYTTSDFVTATLTLDSPLPANTPLTLASGFPGFSLSMNDGIQTLTNTDGGITPPILPNLGTDANGMIVEWDVLLSRDIVVGPFSSFEGSIRTVNNGLVVRDEAIRIGGGQASIAGHPGSWTCSGMCPAPVPVPSAMLLFGTGLAGLVGWRWCSTKTT